MGIRFFNFSSTIHATVIITVLPYLRWKKSDDCNLSQIGRHHNISNLSKDIENIYEVRLSLEVLALEKSFDSLDQNILLDLKEKYINLEKKFSWEIARKLDEDFHNYFINKANNETLSEILIKLNKQVSVYRTIASKDPNRSEKTIKEHMKIIEAISKKDKAKAIESLKIHLNSVKKSAIEASLM